MTDRHSKEEMTIADQAYDILRQRSRGNRQWKLMENFPIIDGVKEPVALVVITHPPRGVNAPTVILHNGYNSLEDAHRSVVRMFGKPRSFTP